MAQYTLANQAGALFRAALNTVLGKLQRNYYGTTDPSSASESTPGMFWMDTNGANPILKVRNASDTAWGSGFRVEASAVVWVGSVESAAATLTGGTMNGVVIGGSTPAAATFTTVSATGDVSLAATSGPIFRMTDTDATSTFAQTRLRRDNVSWAIQTASSAGVFVANDYIITHSATGATQHAWNIVGTERLRVTASGITVTGAVSISGGASITGTLQVNNDILPITAGVHDIGDAVLGRFATIFLTNSPNVSSDARLKSEIADLTDAERRAAARMKTRTFTMIATGQRKVGYVAQEIIAAMEAEGLDAFAYGLVTDGETYGVDMDAINAFRLG
jgi:hypothetical protein